MEFAGWKVTSRSSSFGRSVAHKIGGYARERYERSRICCWGLVRNWFGSRRVGIAIFRNDANSTGPCNSFLTLCLGATRARLVSQQIPANHKFSRSSLGKRNVPFHDLHHAVTKHPASQPLTPELSCARYTSSHHPTPTHPLA